MTHKKLDICTKYLSDREYLEHMIPHHQVAIDMSKILIQYTYDKNLTYTVRKIIFSQQDEILLMNQMLTSFTPNMASNDKFDRRILKGLIEYYYPDLSQDKNAKCHKHFFTMSKSHLSKMKDDKDYLKHMIPHHQVAVNMSERLLNHTSNPFMISFAYGIITNQKYEIWLMKQMYENKYGNCNL